MQLKKKHRKHSYKSRKKCWYCGTPLRRSTATLDHVLPRSRGGDGTPENVVLACRGCNNRKDDMTVDEFRWHLFKERGSKEPVVFHGEKLVKGEETRAYIQN